MIMKFLRFRIVCFLYVFFSVVNNAIEYCKIRNKRRVFGC